MAGIPSLRSDNFQVFLSLQSQIKDAENTINRLAKGQGDYIPFFARIAAPFMRKTATSLGRIIRCKLGQEETLMLLKEAALTLHQIVIRCSEYASFIATKAFNFYQQIIDILPSGTALQLELLGQGDYRREFEPPMLMLPVIAKWWQERGQWFNAPQKKAVDPNKQPLQLCLDLDAAVAVEDSNVYRHATISSIYNVSGTFD